MQAQVHMRTRILDNKYKHIHAHTHTQFKKEIEGILTRKEVNTKFHTLICAYVCICMHIFVLKDLLCKVS